MNLTRLVCREAAGRASGGRRCTSAAPTRETLCSRSHGQSPGRSSLRSRLDRASSCVIVTVDQQPLWPPLAVGFHERGPFHLPWMKRAFFVFQKRETLMKLRIGIAALLCSVVLPGCSSSIAPQISETNSNSTAGSNESADVAKTTERPGATAATHEPAPDEGGPVLIGPGVNPPPDALPQSGSDAS